MAADSGIYAGRCLAGKTHLLGIPGACIWQRCPGADPRWKSTKPIKPIELKAIIISGIEKK